MIGHENLGLITGRSTGRQDITHYFISDCLTEMKLGESSKGSSIFPLYIYPEEKNLFESRQINLNKKIWEKLQSIVDDQKHGKPDEVDIFDYIYGYLHKYSFRKAYAQFLKSDFPYIPWPKNSDEFWNITKSGLFLRKLHLMDPEVINNTQNSFIGNGDNKIENVRFDSTKVWINDNQYFDNVNELTWSIVICGYQPAQKWLTDRKNRYLLNEDIEHYQSILKILSETDRVIKNG
jgi:predicted helicase